MMRLFHFYFYTMCSLFRLVNWDILIFLHAIFSQSGFDNQGILLQRNWLDLRSDFKHESRSKESNNKTEESVLHNIRRSNITSLNSLGGDFDTNDYQRFRLTDRITTNSPISGHSKRRTLLISRQIYIPWSSLNFMETL